MSKNWFLTIIFSFVVIIECILITQFGLKTINPQILKGSVSSNPTITVTSPSGGEQFTVGSTQYVKWTSTNVNKVAIYICAEIPAMVCSIVPGLPIDGINASLKEYRYTVPKIAEFSDNQIAMIRIFDVSSRYKVYGQSKNFTITTGVENTTNDATPKSGVSTSALNNISITKAFTKSGVVYKLQAKPIYSLYISGERTISKSDGYVRVILTDTSNKKYLIYEAIGPYDSGNSSLDKSCDETCNLNGITPKEISVEISGASIKIETISVAENKDSLVTSKSALQSSTAKLAKVQNYIKSNNLGWTAGETSVSKLSYEGKRKLLGIAEGKELPNMQGFEYYKGGVFQISGNNTQTSKSVSNLPSSFDWRNRHGENWLTPIRNQESCGSCWAFGATGAVEAVTNLYYNQHLDVDLSEQDLVSCSGAGDCDGGVSQDALKYYSYDGVVLEDCFKYKAQDLSCNNKCSGFKRTAVIKTGNPGETINNFNEENIKQQLITRGPLSASVGNGWNHAMALIGWKNEPRYNSPIWIFKNSWGKDFGEQGYANILLPPGSLYVTSVGTPITNPYFSYNINCVDKDNDKYCNWGIVEKKPSTCPSFCKSEKDCDDSNPNLGPFDGSYNCVVPGSNETALSTDKKAPNVIMSDVVDDIEANQEIVFSATANDDNDIVACQLIVGENQKGDLINPGCLGPTCFIWPKYTFQSRGLYLIKLECWDSAGNIGSSSSIKINVSQKCPDCRNSKLDYCRKPTVCSNSCGKIDSQCIGKEPSGWLVNGICNSCDGDCNYRTSPANFASCSKSICDKSGWNNSACFKLEYNWYPDRIFNCNSKNSAGYVKKKTTINCKGEQTIVDGKCIAMPGNRVVKSQKTENGWYCEFRCNFPICFVSDGCAAAFCIETKHTE